MIFLIGIVCYSLFGSASVLMKYGAPALAHPRGVLTDPDLRWRGMVWVGGIVTNLGHVAMATWALNFIPASVLSSFNGVGLAVTAVASRMFLKEHINREMLIGIVTIVLGTGLLGVAASTTPQELSFADRSYILFAALILVPFIASVVASWRASWRWATLVFSLGGGGVAALSFLTQKILGIRFFAEPSFWMLIEDPYFWFFNLVAHGSFILFQVACQFGQAVVVVPLFSTALIVLPALGGIFVFGEQLSPLQYVGVAVALSGMVVLGLARGPEPDPGPSADPGFDHELFEHE